MSPVTVEIEDLSVSYLTFSGSGIRRRKVEVNALSNINLELRKGDALGLLGHNGSGKSTLLRAVAGLIPPTAGSVRVAAQPHLLGVRAALNMGLTGNDNIRMCCLALGLEADELVEASREIGDFTELAHFLELPVNTYSAGMTARLAFAISIIARPEILLMDEALAVGDRAFKQKSLERLREFTSEIGTLVLATHAMVEVQENCNKALWLNNGEVAMFGEPADVVKEYQAHRKSVGFTR